MASSASDIPVSKLL
ncbi:unnamed protein product, partial [Litomosoides sigmodontis]